jgi:hypothetical protein
MIRMPTTLGDLGDFLRDRGSLGTAAEIGVAEGRFSATLLAWGFRHLTLVDLWKESPELRGDASNSQAWHDVNYRGMLEHIDPWSDRVTILRGYSHEQAVHVADQSLDFVYVDANHFYGGVMAEDQAGRRYGRARLPLARLRGAESRR